MARWASHQAINAPNGSTVYICICNALREKQLVKVANGIKSLAGKSLKQAQIASNPSDVIQMADNMLAAMPQLAFSDARFARYSELSRLTQLMLHQQPKV